jgi:phosphopantothenoylcysteine decarboxylase / phosphopantothenate---cysteine ligase
MIEPGEGLLACGYTGKGRLEEPETIVQVVERYFSNEQKRHQLLDGKRIVITAGGTIERLDPVRFISNDSSGKMGFALARVARQLGAEVTLVVANTQVGPPAGIKVISVESAQEMYEAVLGLWSTTDIVIKAAAVADYRPKVINPTKLKKQGQTMTLELVKNIDILETLGSQKTSQFLIGFAAETNDLEHYAMDKLRRKNCDLLIANDVSVTGAGFGTDTNIVHIYDAQGLVTALPLLSKDEVAMQILELTAQRLDGANQ